jgi:hypothetical protein
VTDSTPFPTAKSKTSASSRVRGGPGPIVIGSILFSKLPEASISCLLVRKVVVDTIKVKSKVYVASLSDPFLVHFVYCLTPSCGQLG